MKRYVIVALVICPFSLHAQNTLYFMERLPQKLSFNPAFVPEVNFYLSLPGMSGFSGNIYNSGFNYNELDYFLDRLSDKNYSPDNFVRSIGDFNRTIAEIQADIFAFGFKTKKDGYFSFNITANTATNIRATSDIAYLLADLDDIQDEDFPIRIDDIDLNTTTCMTYSFTYSRPINENITIGISPKLNFNQFGIQTKNIGYVVELEKTEYEKEYNQYPLGEVLLGMPVEINPEAINGDELDLGYGLFPDNWTDNKRMVDLFKNISLTLDLGATYKLNDWTFSASILNIGASKWRTNAYRLKGDNEAIRVKKEKKISVGIPAQIYFGANHKFSPRWNYGLVLNNTFYKSGSLPSATVSLNGYVGQMLSTSISYTAGYKFDNLGLGLRLRFLPGMDLFMVTDNIIQTFNLKNAYRLSVAVGINFAFGITGETNKTM